MGTWVYGQCCQVGPCPCSGCLSVPFWMVWLVHSEDKERYAAGAWSPHREYG